MGKDDYTVASGGLKFKGAKNAGIDKKRKNTKRKTNRADAVDDSNKSAAHDVKDVLDKAAAAEPKDGPEHPRKTEAERRHDELRRKRLAERLQREGVKTHKERVEELNKHLSSLSEHHDMPKIGPG